MCTSAMGGDRITAQAHTIQLRPPYSLNLTKSHEITRKPQSPIPMYFASTITQYFGYKLWLSPITLIVFRYESIIEDTTLV